MSKLQAIKKSLGCYRRSYTFLENIFKYWKASPSIFTSFEFVFFAHSREKEQKSSRWRRRLKCGDRVKIVLQWIRRLLRGAPVRVAPRPARVCLKKFTSSSSELRIGPQAGELLRRVFLCSHHGCLAEAGSDIVKRPALGLRHFEVGEDEEYEQQHDEDDEHIGTAQLLRKHSGAKQLGKWACAQLNLI